MQLTIRCVASVAMLVLLGASGPDGSSDFLNGLDALQGAHFTQAVASLNKAVDADEENPDYRIARAVALILSEKLPNARADLERALKLRPRDEAARLWLATDVAMQGDFQADSDIYPYAQFNKEYPNEIRRMSHDYGQYGWETRNSGAPPAPNSDTTRKYQAAKASFPRLAGAFVSNMETTLSADRAWAALLRDRAVAHAEAPSAPDSLNDLQRQLSAHPNDPTLLCAHAAAVLKLGAPALARVESTWAMTADTARADAYLTRAAAAQSMGDSKRSAADLAIASGLNPGLKHAGQALVGAPPFKADEIASQLAALRKMARSGADWESLVTQATSIAKGESIVRKRYEEDYQDRLRILTSAALQQPKNAARQAELGAFLYHTAIDIPGEVVEPRASFLSYRRVDQQGQENELARAEKSLDAALEIDPQNMLAITVKADSLMRRLQWADAEALIRQALGTKGNDPALLDLFSRVIDHAANVRAFKAQSLRTPEHWEDALYFYTRSPSQSELDQADQFDRQANQLWAVANDAMNAAVKALQGTATGYKYAAVVAMHNGDLDGAIADIQQAIKLSPDDAGYHSTLADLYQQKQMTESATDEQVVALNLVNTTCAPLLRAAWPQIQATRFKSARKAMARAIELDPSDARPLAYLGMIELQDTHPDEARGCFTAALALNEARGRLMGMAGATPAMNALPPSVVGLAMAISNQLAKLELESHDPAAALQTAERAIVAGNRVIPALRYQGVPTSMLPGENPDVTTVMPAALNSITLLAWAHLHAADALAALGKPREAMNHYAATLKCKTETPPTADAGMPLRLPAAYAAMALGKEYLKQHNGAAAVQVLSGNGISNVQDRELWQQYNDLMNRAVNEANRQTQR